jgi:hypothetical protein
MKGHARPVSLKTDVIKHRNRSKGEGARKAAVKAAIAAGYPPLDPNYTGATPGYSRGGSTSRTREGAGYKSGPGADADTEMYDDDQGDAKRARHGGAQGGHSASPARRGRGSTSRGPGSRSSSAQRRSDSSESRSFDGQGQPQMMAYPMFYYPTAPGQGGPVPMQAYQYPYAPPGPPPEWANWMQSMGQQQQPPPHMVHHPGMHPSMHPGMPPYSMMHPQHVHPSLMNGMPAMQMHFPPQQQQQQQQPEGSEHDRGLTLPPMRATLSPNPASVDGFGNMPGPPRSDVNLPPLRFVTASEAAATASSGPTSAPLPASLDPLVPPISPRLGSYTSASPAYYHPYRLATQHPRTTSANISDARLTPPQEPRQRRASDAPRPQSSASSSAGSNEGRVGNGTGASPVAQQRQAGETMTIDEVDEGSVDDVDVDGDGEQDPDHPAALIQRDPDGGPTRAGPAYERRGRSSTRKPMPSEVQERLARMRMQESPLLPPGMKLPSLPPGLARGEDEPVDEVTALRLRVAELEFVNGLLQTRIGELETTGASPASRAPTSESGNSSTPVSTAIVAAA